VWAGLHHGWAIEGAIGSEHKVDASYLSPHVNMSARLEAATKQFGVGLLISGAFHTLLSKEKQNKCRKIDIVKVVPPPSYLHPPGHGKQPPMVQRERLPTIRSVET
jgi:hypothetical protein